MRAIDADELIKQLNPEYIKTETLIRKGEAHLDTLAEGYTEVHRLIQNASTIDAVPVVRCKDCTYYRDSNHIDHGCSSVYGITEPDDNDFCSYGHRKEDAHEVSE